MVSVTKQLRSQLSIGMSGAMRRDNGGEHRAFQTIFLERNDKTSASLWSGYEN